MKDLAKAGNHFTRIPTNPVVILNSFSVILNEVKDRAKAGNHFTRIPTNPVVILSAAKDLSASVLPLNLSSDLEDQGGF